MLENNSTLETTKNHLGSEPRKNPDTVSQVSETPKSLTIFIPGNLNLKKILITHPPQFSFKRDEGLYLLDLIYKLSAEVATDISSPDLFARPQSVLMQRRVRNYRKYLDYFTGIGILVEDRQYIKGKKSRGFHYKNEYLQSEIKHVKIKDKKLIKKILNFYETGSHKKTLDVDESELSYLLKWLEDGKLNIDYDSAKAHLKQLHFKDTNSIEKANRLKKESKEYKRLSKKADFHFKEFQREQAYYSYNSRLRSLIQFHKSTFFPCIDKTAGRLHSVLTQLKSDLRQYITYNGQPLVAVDIVNSQPYLATVLLNYKKFIKNNIPNIIQQYNPKYNHTNQNSIMLAKIIQDVQNKENISDYIKSVSKGKFYEEFGTIINIDTSVKKNRKIVKDATFSALFSPNEKSQHIKEVQLFKKVFPDVYKIFRKIKSSKGNHRALACTLQNFEAKLILHTACKRINEINPDIPMFTLHDSIITIPEYKNIVSKVMTDVLTNATGIIPNLRFERWERVA